MSDVESVIPKVQKHRQITDAYPKLEQVGKRGSIEKQYHDSSTQSFYFCTEILLMCSNSQFACM